MGRDMNGEGYKLGTLPGHEQEMTYDQLCSTPLKICSVNLVKSASSAARCVCTGAVCVCANAGGGETEMNRWSNRWSDLDLYVWVVVRQR